MHEVKPIRRKSSSSEKEKNLIYLVKKINSSLNQLYSTYPVTHALINTSATQYV